MNDNVKNTAVEKENPKLAFEEATLEVILLVGDVVTLSLSDEDDVGKIDPYD